METTEFREPFRHWLVSGIVDRQLIDDALRQVPPANDPAWIRYDNDFESRKWAMEDYGAMDFPWQRIMDALRDPRLVSAFSELLGVRLQLPEMVSRGGGLHLMFAGGYLAPHIDAALHPSGLERRANLILFLSNIGADIGGELALGLPPGMTFVYPREGEAVFWECGDETYHSVTRLQPHSTPRVTAAAYYFAEPRPGCTRTRALFCPNRG